MAAPGNILIYGKDERLLQTRQMVLEKSGYAVQTASDMSELLEVADHVDLLILCHTIALEECGRAIALCQVRWPESKTLFMSAGDLQCAASLPSEVVDAMDGPEKLVSTVGRIVGAGSGVQTPLQSFSESGQ